MSMPSSVGIVVVHPTIIVASGGSFSDLDLGCTKPLLVPRPLMLEVMQYSEGHMRAGHFVGVSLPRTTRSWRKPGI